jgi:carbon starvation protein CstA
VAEGLKLDQRPIPKRLVICVPLFAVSIAMLIWQMENPDGFNTIWQYFGWSNQTLSVFTLWTLTVWLARENKPYWITLIPAIFMTVVCSSFLVVSKNAFGFDITVGYTVGVISFVVACVWFTLWYRKEIRNSKNQ